MLFSQICRSADMFSIFLQMTFSTENKPFTMVIKYLSVPFFWKIKLEKSGSTNWIFVYLKLGFYYLCTNFLVDFCRLKIQFVELDFSKIKYRWIQVIINRWWSKRMIIVKKSSKNLSKDCHSWIWTSRFIRLKFFNGLTTYWFSNLAPLVKYY